jgi:hypothetical protein
MFLKHTWLSSPNWQRGLIIGLGILSLLLIYFFGQILIWSEKTCLHSSWLSADTKRCSNFSYVLLRGAYSLLTLWWAGLIIVGIPTAIGYGIDKIIREWKQNF